MSVVRELRVSVHVLRLESRNGPVSPLGALIALATTMRLTSYGVVMKFIAASAIAMFLNAAVPGVAAADEGSADLLAVLPEKEAYTPGMQVPPEYRVVEGPRKALLVSGAATFGVSYLAMASFGIYGLATTNDQSGASMLIPVVSPIMWIFAPIGSGFGLFRTALLVDGVLQAAGIGLLIAGAVTPGKYLKRRDIAAVMPSVSVGPRSVGLQWSF